MICKACGCQECVFKLFKFGAQVMDSLVVSLSKFTSMLNPLAFKPVIAFGENDKARAATEAVFTVANR